MTSLDIQDILSGKASPTVDAALEMLREHPTCVLPAAMCLRAGAQGASPEDRRRLIHAVALGCADRIAMADLADLSGQDWASIYPQVETQKQKTTRDAINIFIETYGHSSAEEDALLEKLIFNPVAPDYFQDIDEPYDPADPLALPPELMAEPEKKGRGEEASKLDGSINSERLVNQDRLVNSDVPEGAGRPEGPVDSGLSGESDGAAAVEGLGDGREEPSLMESLAKIYIKQRKYGRALEIINNLSLKYPEKSVYFADQIRFLRKLVNNQRRWDASRQG